MECTACKRLGHNKDKCSKTRDVTDIGANQEYERNTYACKIRINGHDIDGLVDKGSARSHASAIVSSRPVKSDSDQRPGGQFNRVCKLNSNGQ